MLVYAQPMYRVNKMIDGIKETYPEMDDTEIRDY